MCGSVHACVGVYVHVCLLSRDIIYWCAELLHQKSADEIADGETSLFKC